jgi:two-component system nitrogen regulation response regulator NtrX
MTPERMEEELFGVEDGTGAARRVGALEEAHSGTLYIDELADMPMETQGKVLRVLVDQTFQRVGGAKKVKVDVRVVSSSSRDLPSLIAMGRFREDLYHRLSVMPVHVPGLSERREDIPELISHFAKSYSLAAGQPVRKFGDDAIAVLQTREWNGNVRELRNNVERILIIAPGEPTTEITAAMLPSDTGGAGAQAATFGIEHLLVFPLARGARGFFERDYITAQLGRFGGNISKTAQFIGMERSACTARSSCWDWREEAASEEDLGGSVKFCTAPNCASLTTAGMAQQREKQWPKKNSRTCRTPSSITFASRRSLSRCFSSMA